MKNSVYGILLGLISIVVLSNCGSQKKAVETNSTQLGTRPSWVTSRPVDAAYYIGVAVASKTANPTSYSSVAQRNALNELASSIEVRVKSNSMLFTFEEDDQHRDEFKEFVQVKTSQKIEHYEEVAAWENAYEYWVYYRLSKEQYLKDKQEKINKATNMSINLLQQGEEAWTQGSYKNGMKLFFDALTPIKPYLGEPLEVTLNGTKEVYLGNYILNQISQGVRVFNIDTENSSINVSWGAKVESKNLTFIVSDFDGKIISQIPVNFSYSEGIIRPRSAVSGGSGMVSTEIKKLNSTNNLQEVIAQIDFETMILGAKRPDEISKLILDNMDAQKATIKLQVSAPTIYVYSKERSFNKGGSNILRDAFENKATEMGFVLSKSKKTADLVVFINANTTQAGETYDLNNSYLKGSVVVTDNKSEVIVYQEKLGNLKGVSNSFSGASKEAYKKGEEQIRKKIVPRFYRKYTR